MASAVNVGGASGNNMATYIITATKYDDPKSQGASKFKLWSYNAENKMWYPSEGVTKKTVVDLIQKGHVVKTGKEVKTVEGKTRIDSGAAVEIVLRVSKNDVGFPIGEMPEL